MAQLASDPDFNQFKDDPGFWARLNENLSQENYNQALPVSTSQQEEPLTYAPNFATWGNTPTHAFYLQDQAALGRMLAEIGGDYDPGYRY
jgi:hypothetical protein